MIRKICPCFAWLSKDQKQKVYQPQAEIEEEQFMNQLKQEAKKSQIYSQITTGQQISIEEQLNLELNLTQNSKASEDQKRDEENSSSQKKEKSLSEEYQQLLELETAPKFKLNIDHVSEYYSIINEASIDIENLLNTAIDCTEINIERISGDKSKFRLWRKATSENQRAFVVQYQLPCSYAFYTDFMSKSCFPKNKDRFFHESRLIESIYPNLCSKYLCLNKINSLDKREFRYLKYTNGSSKYHWEVCKSVDTIPIQNDYNAKNCPLHAVSLLTEEQDEEGGQFLRVKAYIKVELGVSLNSIWQKIFEQGVSFVEQMWRNATEKYEQELV